MHAKFMLSISDSKYSILMHVYLKNIDVCMVFVIYNKANDIQHRWVNNEQHTVWSTGPIKTPIA